MGENNQQSKKSIKEEIFDKYPGLVYVFNLKEQKTTIVNKEVYELLGYKPDEIVSIGDGFIDTFMHPDDVPGFMKYVKTLSSLNEGETGRFEYRMKVPDGSYKWFLSHDVVFKRNHKNKAKALLGIATDISERKMIEEEIASQKERLSNIIESTNLGTWEWNVQTGETIFNEQWANIIGYTLEELSPVSIETWINNTHPDDLAASDELLKRHFNGEQEYYNIECRMKHKNGSWVYVYDCGKVISRTKDGEPLWMFGTHQNVTGKRQAEKALIEKEEEYRLLVENQTDLIVKVDADGKFIFVSDSYCSLFGKSREDLIGKSFVPLVHKDDREKTMKAMEELFVPPYKCRIEQRAMTSIGWRWLEWDDSAIVDNEGNVVFIIGAGRDITQNKQTEEALRNSEENLRITLKSIGDAVISTDLKGRIVQLNSVAEKLTGWSHEKAKGEKLSDVFHIINANTREEVENPVQKVLKNGEIIGLANHTTLISSDGKEYQIADSAAPIYNDKKIITGVVLVFRDITEEYLIQEKIKQDELFLKSVFSSIQDGISVLDANLNIIHVNDVMNKWYEANTPLVGKKCYQCYHNYSKPCDPCPTLSAFKTGKTEMEIVKGLSGSEVSYIELYSYPLKDIETGEITGVIEFVRDISEKKQAEDALIKSKDELEIALEEARKSKELVIANKKLRETEKELRQKHQQLEQLNEELKESHEETQQMNEELSAANEKLYEQRDDLENALKKLKEAQLQLVQSEKMASIGMMAAGVAHELNNPLNFISGGVTALEAFIQDHFPEQQPDLTRLLNNIKTGIDRSARIIQSMNQFSRESNGKQENCDLHIIIDNCLVILQNRLKHKIEVIKNYTNEGFCLRGDEGKLHQVFINILTNAEQAIIKKGTITIKTRLNKNNVIIEIADNGSGISKNDIEKITEPFYTTKKSGEGTGLGLSITQKIVQEHHGNLSFNSQKGKGTTVFITLPIY